MALTYASAALRATDEVSVFESRLGSTLMSGGKLPEDGALQDADGTFTCTHCGERQAVLDSARRVCLLRFIAVKDTLM